MNHHQTFDPFQHSFYLQNPPDQTIPADSLSTANISTTNNTTANNNIKYKYFTDFLLLSNEYKL